MLFEKVNIEDKLKSIANDKGADLLNEVKSILASDDAKDAQILENLSQQYKTSANQLIFDKLETNRIYHISQIKKTCVNYRLRFLDTKLFKGEIPYEAVSKIKQLEKEHNTQLSGFKIIAPAKLFKLENYDDPLLFAPIGNGYYYLCFSVSM